MHTNICKDSFPIPTYGHSSEKEPNVPYLLTN